MEVKHFAELFPTLYHVTFASNLENIRNYGLLSTADLADQLAFDEIEREATLGTRRICIQTVRGASIRDQHPAAESKMKSCLVKITPAEWRELLNSKIFFFVDRNKALRLAETYSAYENLLIETDTAQLLQTHAASASLCRINSGSFLYKAVPRGAHSFIPLASYIYKNKRDTPVEFTLNKPVPNIVSISKVDILESFKQPLRPTKRQ